MVPEVYLVPNPALPDPPLPGFRRVTSERRKRGGAEGTRTPDFCLAKAALYQLSYGPWNKPL
jgi:hypothetical protein